MGLSSLKEANDKWRQRIFIFFIDWTKGREKSPRFCACPEWAERVRRIKKSKRTMSECIISILLVSWLIAWLRAFDVLLMLDDDNKMLWGFQLSRVRWLRSWRTSLNRRKLKCLPFHWETFRREQRGAINRMCSHFGRSRDCAHSLPLSVALKSLGSHQT